MALAVAIDNNPNSLTMLDVLSLYTIGYHSLVDNYGH